MRTTEIKNAVIRSASFDRLTAWVQLEFGDSFCQSFGGWLLYGPKGWKTHGQGNYCGHFIWRVLEVAGVDDWSKLAGRTIRAKASWDKVHAIGHIIKEDWFDPEKEFREMPARTNLASTNGAADWRKQR